MRMNDETGTDMFTGIITAVGRLAGIEPAQLDTRLRVDTGGLDLGDAQLGESIAVNGVCLTAVEFDGSLFSADVSRETLSRTTLGDLKTGDRVNLERALRLADRLGGHLVSGHVDGVGAVVERVREGRSIRYVIEVPAALSRYISSKGSICVDGVSLTVNTVDRNRCTLQVIPHTETHTIIGEYAAGRRVNIEVDVVARYLERLLDHGLGGEPAGVTRELLTRHGFLGNPAD